ncbi:hypothetical protein CVT25_001110 [Psilocybe cyanescens]|uniref:Protein kinase domain-containing protein n=1 Tax=Psilocybe cyanescens TaxID=93625 RepID=A0A409XUV1_PSICY|nr:hypothetical protein CVT25_001110 [Psilocybe cyanescens]
MSSRTKDALSNAERELQRQKYQAKLATALNEEDDPLAVYHQFVQWTIKNYGESDPKSGLVELLKEATTQFKEDSLYKTDLRYLKLWALYARQMDKAGAISIYAYLLDHDIGTSYSALYEDYANLLEDTNRRQDADTIYRRGIKKSARPVERLKTRYREFQSRGPSSSSASPSMSPPSSSTVPSAKTISNMAKGHAKSGPSSASSTTPTYTGSFNSTAAARYALMLAPPAPGKRPEKLRFNISLLFTEEGVEYSIQEARARSMGLLGKKWGPPPPSEISRFSSSTSSSSSSLAMVDFNDDGQKSSRLKSGGRRSIMGGAEPTVTINTKEALADVFGMYNSPDKTTKLVIPGSKHAPLKKVEPITPVVPPRMTFSRENENADRQTAKTPTPAFRPFTDENAQPNQSRTPGAKFTPFVDADQQKTPFMTPRAVLTVKDTAPPSSLRFAADPSESDAVDAEEKSAGPVYARVFTPASKAVPLAPLRDVFTDDHGKPTPKTKAAPTHERAKSHHDVLSPQVDGVRPSAFTPFKDENARAPFKVFSRPPEQGDNAHMPAPKTPSAAFKPFSDAKPPAFTPFKDITPAFTPFVEPSPKSEPHRVLQPSRTTENAHPSSSRPVVEIEDDDDDPEPVEEPEPERHHNLEQEDGDQYYEEEEDSHIEEYVPLAAEHLPEEYEEGDSYQDVPLGGRFGQFNVMTPITERTFEFTSSTRGGTPSERQTNHGDGGQRAEYQAARAAALLAEELRESDEEEEEENHELEPLRLSVEQPAFQGDPEVVIIEERPGTLSLLDTLTLSSKFRPSNPCNPFDPAIISSLITRIPADPHFYDLRTQQSNMLAELQKFAKKSRKTSSSSNVGVLDSGSFSLTLQGHQFMVTEKLGEGGFGCVFKARDKGVRAVKDGDDEEDDEDEEEEEEEEVSSMVALKVVKPRNIWEYHVLRRLHSALPPSLRRSVVLPHALYAYSDESHLVLDLCPQGMLLNIVNNAASAGVAQAGACLDELLVVFFAIELLRLLEVMHNTGFIHGDLKIDNCLLRLEEVPGGAAAWSGTYQPSGDGGWSHKGLKVIDFGRTIDMRLFPPGQQFIADWATDDRDCFEVRENRPWTYQTDYFGLAGIIYCMLFGKYIQANSVVAYMDEDGLSRYKIVTPFKRYWQSDLWSRLFDVLLNPCLVRPDGELPVCDAMGQLRKEMEQWLQSNCNRTSNTLKGLLKKVELSCYKM